VQLQQVRHVLLLVRLQEDPDGCRADPRPGAQVLPPDAGHVPLPDHLFRLVRGRRHGAQALRQDRQRRRPHGGVTYDPKGCYLEFGSLKYNSQHKNTGSCTTSDQCLCANSQQAPVVTTRAPTRYPTNYPTNFPTNFPTPSPTRYPTNYPTNYPTRFPTRSPTRYPTPAPVDCKHAAWQPWSTCTKKCGGGSQRRYRTSQRPLHGGKPCKESHTTETQRCNAQPCPIDGGFGMWSAWGSCSKSCDGGVSIQTRACDSPSPQFNGKACVGAAKNTKVCNTNVCNCPTCKVVGVGDAAHIAVGHVTEHAKATHGPRSVHKDCGYKAGGCGNTFVIAHTCKASKGVCACTCKKPTALQRRDHHVITQLPNKFDLVNNTPKNVPHTAWPKISNKHCAGTKADSKTYLTRAAAAAACRLNSKCSGIYDPSCDAKGSWYTCTKNAYASSGMGSCIFKMPPTNVAPTPAPAPKPYMLQVSGKCASPITTAEDCATAAKVLGLSDKTVTDDGQHGGVSYDPKGCYFEQGSLKYNKHHKNTGTCNSIDNCLCRVPMVSTKMVGEEGRPVIKK